MSQLATHKSLEVTADDKKEIVAFLNCWSELMVELENKHDIKRMEVSNLDYAFLKTLGQTLYYINLYNANLYKLFIGYDKDTRPLADYIRFFNSLITSKVKYFFFRECPIVNTNNNDMDCNWDIYFNAIQAVDKICKDMNINTVIKHVYKYMFNLSLVYSVLYNAHTNKGLFLHFHLDDKEGFSDLAGLKEVILKDVCRIESENDIRLFSDDYYIKFFSYYTDKMGLERGVVEQNVKGAMVDIYAGFYDYFKSVGAFSFEKYTYRLGEIIWKFDGMIQDDDEFVCFEEKQERDKKLSQLLKGHIKSYFDLIDSVAKYASPPYVRLFQLESNFIPSCYNVLLKQKKRKDVYAVFDKLESIASELPLSDNDYGIKEGKLGVNRIVSMLRCYGEGGFRLESILTHLDKDDLVGLLVLFSKFISHPKLFKRTTQLVGMYRSGVFLAHIANYLLKIDKPVWLFKTKPYVATHPIHEENFEHSESFYDTVVVFDDVVKTGFTFFMYENYLSRNINRQNLSLSLDTLSGFNYYNVIDSVYSFDCVSFLNLDNSLVPANLTSIKSINNHLTMNFPLPILKREDVDRIIDAITSKGRVDLTYILTNTKICFAVCNYFVAYILDKFEEHNNFAIFSPSQDGNVLSLVIGFMLRLQGKYISFIDNIIPESVVRICVDLSFITGSTFNISLKNFIKPGQAEAIKFDLIMAVLMSKKQINEIENLYALKWVE